MSRAPREVAAAPESDRFDAAPHPRDTLSFFGNAAAERELLDAYRQNRMAHAWLIGGPEGVGKATLAWRLARFLLAHPTPAFAQEAQSLHVRADAPAARRISALSAADVFVLRRSWIEKDKKFYTEIRVDEVREVIAKIHRASGTGGWRIVIVDCAEDLNRSSANALLKLIEEPPERALFLLVSHQPGRILPTIRSRCRKLLLQPLQTGEVVAALRATPDFADAPQDRLEAAAQGAHGSVREALRLLSGEGLALEATFKALFGRLPQVEWSAVHALADRLRGRENAAAYEAFLRALWRFIDARVKARAGEGAAAVAGFAKAWEEIVEAARETDVFNFDRRALIVTIFELLARAERG